MSLNRYIYVTNNPINYKDPSGGCAVTIAYTAWTVFDYVVVPAAGYLIIKYTEYRFKKTKTYKDDGCGSCKLESTNSTKETQVRITHKKKRTKKEDCLDKCDAKYRKDSIDYTDNWKKYGYKNYLDCIKVAKAKRKGCRFRCK